MGLQNFVNDLTGVNAEARGKRKAVEAQNRLNEETRGRYGEVGEQYVAAGDKLGGKYDFLAGRAGGDVGKLSELAGESVPTYGGAGYKGTIDQFLDPSIEYSIEQASKGIQAGAAAQGGLLSGKAQKELMRSAQSIGEQGYADAYARMEGDRKYMTDEERKKFDSERMASDTGYNRQKDLTGMSLKGLGTQTDLEKWGQSGSLDMGTRGAAIGDSSSAGYKDMLEGRQAGDITKGVWDAGMEGAKAYFTGGI